MSRPQKQGLDYLPLDVDMDSDDKIQLIEGEFGIEGFGVIIKVLSKIFATGYYYDWGEKEQLLMSKRCGKDSLFVINVVKSGINWGLFDINLHKKYSILTSKGIQKRYFEIVKKRKAVFVQKEYIVADLSDYNNINNLPDLEKVNVELTGVNVELTTQRKEKKRKGKNIYTPFSDFSEEEISTLKNEKLSDGEIAYWASEIKACQTNPENLTKKGDLYKKYQYSDFVRTALNWRRMKRQGGRVFSEAHKELRPAYQVELENKKSNGVVFTPQPERELTDEQKKYRDRAAARRTAS